MLKMMKADLYRLFKGKGIYITLGFYAFYIALLVATGTSGNVGVMVSVDSTTEVVEAVLYTGKVAALIMAQTTTDNIIYFMLPIIIFIVGTDFSSGTIKNVLAKGMSRLKYYFSKLILSVLFCISMLIVMVVISIIVGTVTNGFGGSFDSEFILQVSRIYGSQLLLLIALISIGIFFVFLTQKTSGTIGAYLAFVMIPTLVILMITELIGKYQELVNYDIVLNIRALAMIDNMSSGDVQRALIIGISYLALSIIGGVWYFSKNDIK